MDSSEVIALYEAVADITDKMLAAARDGNWEQLALLESHCSNKVEIIRKSELPPQTLSPVAREHKVRIIKKILDDDRQIRNITEPWMAKLSVLLNRPGAEPKRSQSYGATQTG